MSTKGKNRWSSNIIVGAVIGAVLYVFLTWAVDEVKLILKRPSVEFAITISPINHDPNQMEELLVDYQEALVVVLAESISLSESQRNNLEVNAALAMYDLIGHAVGVKLASARLEIQIENTSVETLKDTRLHMALLPISNWAIEGERSVSLLEGSEVMLLGDISPREKIELTIWTPWELGLLQMGNPASLLFEGGSVDPEVHFKNAIFEFSWASFFRAIPSVVFVAFIIAIIAIFTLTVIGLEYLFIIRKPKSEALEKFRIAHEKVHAGKSAEKANPD